jgi:hypothetical protein
METAAKKMAPACVAAPEPLVPPKGTKESVRRVASESCLHCGVSIKPKEVVMSASPKPAAGRVCRQTRLSEEEEMAEKSSRGRNQDRASRFGGMARFSVLAVAT